MEEMVQPLNHVNGLLLNSLQYVHVCFVLESLELDKLLQMGSHEGRVEGKYHYP